MVNKAINFIGVSLFVLAMFAFTFTMVNKYEVYQNQKEPININYKTNVLIGFSPNTYSREPTEKDMDTKLNLQTEEGSIYRLFDSRSLEKFDYGKTFVVRIK